MYGVTAAVSLVDSVVKCREATVKTQSGRVSHTTVRLREDVMRPPVTPG